MKEIEVQRPSSKQLAKLRKGHPVRLAKGEGLILVVHPERYDLMSKTFLRGKARTVSLSPEELMANMKTSPEAHQEQMAVEDNKSPSQTNVDKTAKVATPKTSSTVVGSGLKKANRPVSNAGGPRGIAIRTLVGAKDLVHHLGKVGNEVGQHYSPQLESALGNANANAMTASMGRMGIETARQNHIVPQERRGQGLYAGRGLFAGKGVREHSSVNVGGNLLGGGRTLPPALQSQPYGANWQFQFTLPPQFQRYNGGK
jgi:hypothetical protein